MMLHFKVLHTMYMMADVRAKMNGDVRWKKEEVRRKR